MPEFVTVVDLLKFNPDLDETKAEAMILGATATAILKAPCLEDLDPVEDATKFEAVKAILLQAIIRWDGAGSGAVTTYSHGAGPYSESQTVDSRRFGMFTKDELDDLRALCGGSRGAFTVDLTPTAATAWTHAPSCSINFGDARYCSCGADLNNGVPLWE